MLPTDPPPSKLVSLPSVVGHDPNSDRGVTNTNPLPLSGRSASLVLLCLRREEDVAAELRLASIGSICRSMAPLLDRPGWRATARRLELSMKAGKPESVMSSIDEESRRLGIMLERKLLVYGMRNEKSVYGVGTGFGAPPRSSASTACSTIYIRSAG
jgi:hypothetical protein